MHIYLNYAISNPKAFFLLFLYLCFLPLNYPLDITLDPKHSFPVGPREIFHSCGQTSPLKILGWHAAERGIIIESLKIHLSFLMQTKMVTRNFYMLLLRRTAIKKDFIPFSFSIADIQRVCTAGPSSPCPHR